MPLSNSMLPLSFNQQCYDFIDAMHLIKVCSIVALHTLTSFIKEQKNFIKQCTSMFRGMKYDIINLPFGPTYIYSQYNLETSCKFLSGEWYFHLYWTLEILNSESWQEWTAPSSMLKCLFELRGRALITADNRVLILDRSIQVVMYKLRSFCMDNTSKDHSIYRWEGDCCIILCDTSELKSLRNARTVTIIWCDGQTPVHVIRMPSTESQFMHNDNVMDSMQY